VPLEAYVSKFINMRFDPAGMTDDPDIRLAQSVMDYLFRRLALDYLDYETRSELGIFTAEERAAATAAQYGAPTPLELPSDELDVDVAALQASAPIESPTGRVPTDSAPTESEAGGPVGKTRPAAELSSSAPAQRGPVERQTTVDAPMCFACGITMRSAGSCYVCEQCGSTSGCS